MGGGSGGGAAWPASRPSTASFGTTTAEPQYVHVAMCREPSGMTGRKKRVNQRVVRMRRWAAT